MKRLSLDELYLKDINRLMEIRNIFGHCWSDTTDSDVKGRYTGEVKIVPYENDIESYDAINLKKEFEEKYLKVIRYIMTQYIWVLMKKLKDYKTLKLRVVCVKMYFFIPD